nr:piggyBac transposable element-derived protein 2-like [Leptinotarsa decemlineata]
MPLRKQFHNPEDPRDAEELLNYLEQLSSDDEDYEEVQHAQKLELILLPPNNAADSDKDDAPSDEEDVGTIRSIGKGVLREPMEVFSVDDENVKTQLNLLPQKHVSDTDLETSDSESSEDNKPLAILFAKELKEKEIKRNIKKRQWNTVNLKTRNEKSKLPVTPEPSFVQTIRDENLQPIDIFKNFYDEEFMKFFCDESEKYAAFKGDHEFRLSSDELYKYFAILFLSGYCKVPNRRLYWETQPDTFNHLVSNSMSRNRFELIHRYLHFNDNNKIDQKNKIYKIQPLVDHVNRVSQNIFQPLGSNFSVDEAMEPYYGHHSMKQFIKGKPIRYGFKFWCLATSEGYLLKFNPYCGAGEKLHGKTLGSSVCENLCLNYLPEQSTIYIDNYFTSLPLLHTFRGYNLNCIGTIRSDRIEKAPLRDLKKEKRGSTHAITDTANNITLIRWNDNNQGTPLGMYP